MEVVPEKKSAWRIGEIMIQKDWITWGQLREALAIQENRSQLLGEIMVERGFVNRVQVYRALAFQYGLEFVEFKNVHVQNDALRAVPRDCAYFYRFMPLDVDKDSMTIAVSDPDSRRARAAARQVTGVFEVRSVLACPDDLHHALTWYYGLRRSEAA